MTVVPHGFATHARTSVVHATVVALLALVLVGLAMAVGPTNGTAHLICYDYSPDANPVSRDCGVAGLTGIAERPGQDWPDLPR